MIDRVDNVLYPNLFHLFSPSASFSGVVLKQGHKIKGDFKGNCRIVLACQMYCKKGHNFESKNRLTSYWTKLIFTHLCFNVVEIIGGSKNSTFNECCGPHNDIVWATVGPRATYLRPLSKRDGRNFTFRRTLA